MPARTLRVWHPLPKVRVSQMGSFVVVGTKNPVVVSSRCQKNGLFGSAGFVILKTVPSYPGVL